MNSYLVCPVDGKFLNNNVVRINASMVCLIVLVSFFSHTPYGFGVLAIDFFIRGFINKPFSLLNGVSKICVQIFSLGYAKENKPPKVFAAKIGFVLCVSAIVLFIAKFWIAFTIVSGILTVFSFLEAAFSFCAGCIVYTACLKLGIFS